MSNETSPFLTSDRLAPFPIGSWVNLVFFTVQTFQTIHYFRSGARPRDSFFIKLAVITNLFADLAGTVACCATTFLYTATYWGDEEAIKKLYWPLTVLVFAVGVALAVSQFFMIIRYWQMTKHHVVFSFLFMILLGAITGIFGSGVLLALSLDDETVLRVIFMSLGLVASAVGSVLVSPLLFWQIRKRYETRWKSALGTLVETGTFTAVVTIVICCTVPFGRLRETMMWIPFAFVLGPVYSCTLLFALSRRPEPANPLNGIIDTYTAHPPKSKAHRPVGMMVLNMPPTVMEDADAFRLTKKKIELPGRDVDSDSSSDVSRNLNEELEDMEEPGLPRESLSSRPLHPLLRPRAPLRPTPNPHPVSQKTKSKAAEKAQKSKSSQKDSRNEGVDPHWEYTPPSKSVRLEESADVGDFDWDALNGNPDLELWLVRIPEGVKPKHLETAQLGFPPGAKRDGKKSAKLGMLQRKHVAYDIWSVGDDEPEELPITGEEIKDLSCLLPRKSKKGKLYAAPTPIARTIVMAAQPVKPTPDPSGPSSNARPRVHQSAERIASNRITDA
ncbi:hypothetical protein MSAN_01252400 [Mycena sanguinolenta]|uniref:Uncharacterized protein n=1 Tax=Mycena sanguinolenta TaxID=230812 RepID=A0A8H7D203_9AGAR|nr:hypothetical protein MSAN_01252400 [Mycena sanguinolenta]